MKQTTKSTLRESMSLPFLAAFILLGVVAANADYPSTILSNNPVAYYRLEELPGASVAADSSGNNFNATINYNSDLSSPQLGLPGIDTNSYLFAYGPGGPSDYGYVDIPYNILLSPTNGDGVTGAPFSAECWVEATSDSTSDYTSPLAMSGAYTVTYPNGSGWNFYQTQGTGSGATPAGSWAVFVRGAAGTYGINGPSVVKLQWYHLVVTWDGTNATFYVNGVSQGSAAINYEAVDPNVGYDGAIGAGPQTGHGAFVGGVDEVAFYTNVLTPAQILNHYQVGTNSFRAPLVPPSFVSVPASTTNYSGTLVTFSALVSGNPAPTYQWFRDVTNKIQNATNSSYSFVCQYPADNGATFSIEATNILGSTNSPPATLTVSSALNILGPPFSIVRNVGSHAAFRVAANGALPITYQWSVSTNGGTSYNSISGQTSDTLWLTNVQLSMGGNYYAVLVSNPFTSSNLTAYLSVQPRAVNVPLTNSAYPKIVAADQPVAYYRLDETNGSTTAVDAVGTFDGTYDNSLGPITWGIAPGIPNETDPAIDVADTNEVTIGQGGKVTIPYALELNPFGPWSAEAWVRPDSNDTHGNFRTVFSSIYNFNFSTAVYGWLIYQHPNGGQGAWTLVLYNGTGAASFFGSDFGHIPLIPGSWYHLVLTDDGTNIQLYVNGVAGSANTTVAASGFQPNGINGNPLLAGNSEVLGQRSDGAFFGFSGAIDEVAFYNYALSPQQIQNHLLNSAKLGVARLGNNIVLSWPVGTLLQATNVSGPYLPAPGNPSSPYTNAPAASHLFYRVQIFPDP